MEDTMTQDARRELDQLKAVILSLADSYFNRADEQNPEVGAVLKSVSGDLVYALKMAEKR